ncbi:60S ribosomal protein L12 [Myotis brandtii]|uniref:60S ribosomal protein L12 n=1 Tax=Myotis brandtii TaxID=109478 RepID=S7Q5G3_MYOBR|nr:60S ribosomal protein L12 [Myotis brandtii]
MPPKFNPNKIKVIYLTYPSGEVVDISALVPKSGSLVLSPKKVGDDITKTTSDWKGLRITVKQTIQKKTSLD